MALTQGALHGGGTLKENCSSFMLNNTTRAALSSAIKGAASTANLSSLVNTTQMHANISGNCSITQTDHRQQRQSLGGNIARTLGLGTHP